MTKNKKDFRLVILFPLVLLICLCTGCSKQALLKKVYPIKYQDYVEKYAEEYNLDKYLVYAVIKVESKFNPEAISNAGAVGLMQVMEDTAKECNEKGGFGYDIPEDLSNPEVNIRIGCYYLNLLYEKYGDMELAVMAYNGGKGNVDKWLADESLSDGNGGLVEIPYEETKKYVEKVFNALDTYNELYNQNGNQE